MAITGIHALLYTSEPEALRQVLADVFGWSHVDAGDGWLIFRLPPAEMAVHPAEAPAQQLTLMCDDLEATIDQLRGAGVVVSDDLHTEDWGVFTMVDLPGQVQMMLYEPRHQTAI